VLTMRAAAHDRALAKTSHMPHLLAAALAATTPEALLQFTAGGWLDTTRVAAGDVGLWTEILMGNQLNVLTALGGLESTLADFRQAIEQGDRRRLSQLLRKGKRIRDAVGS